VFAHLMYYYRSTRAWEQEDIMVLAIYTKMVVRALLIAVLFLTLAGLAARFALYMWGEEELLKPLTLFDVGEERSIPTWFESILFLLCSILLAVITVAKRQRGDRFSLHWGVLSIIFLLLSMDEVATIHEIIGAEFERLLRATIGFEAGGAISFFWVVPGAAFVLIVVLSYLRFLVHLPRRTRRLFLFAGALFVLGALGMEMLTAEVVSSSSSIANWVVSASGGMVDQGSANAIPTILKGLQTSVEEMFEMLGLTALVYTLLGYIRSDVEDITVRVLTDKSV
jgi:hypothetical protein